MPQIPMDMVFWSDDMVSSRYALNSCKPQNTPLYIDPLITLLYFNIVSKESLEFPILNCL